MATIGSLAVNVVARTDQFSRGMQRARKDLTLLERGTATLQRSLVRLGGAMAAVFTAQLGVQAVRAAAEEMDRLAKSADSLGVAVGALQGLTRAAELSGTSGATLVTALKMMEKNVAANSAAFHKLGLDVEFLRQLKPEHMFLRIAEAIRKIPDPSQRMARTLEVFGRGGQQLLPLLLEGESALGAAMSGGVSRLDAASVEAANDAMTRLGHAFQDIANTIAIGLAPHVEQFADWLSGLAGKGTRTDAFDQFTDQQFERFRQQWNEATKQDARSNMPFLPLSARGRLLRERGWSFSDVTRGNVANIEASIEARIEAMNRRVEEQLAAERAKTSGMGGLGLPGVPMPLLLNWQLIGRLAGTRSEVSDFGQLADWHRFQQRVEASMLGPAAPAAPTGMPGAPARGFQALEGNTAAAFAQMRRSQVQEQDVAKQQLAELKKQTEQLQRIDAHQKQSAELELVNIA